jgi:hypothetical protein
MPVYFVTGKLGGGKSIVSVARIRDKLNAGLPVATNLDINLVGMLGRNKKNTRLLRIPDKPSIEDLEAIGVGNKSYDEEKNGLLVLDECGTWFNSRSWNDKGRQLVINWLLHARKLGWDIIFIIQDLSLVDKQARLALAEHVVYCRRSDRVNIPFIGALFKLITGSRLPLPKMHFGIVKYGDSPTSLKVDTWNVVGTGLYSCYDTKQAFSDHYEHTVYSVLPPYTTHGRYTVPMTVKNIMRITKIYARKWSRVMAFTVGVVLTFIFMILSSDDINLENEVVEPVEVEQVQTLSEQFNGWLISSYSSYPNQPARYTLVDIKGVEHSSIMLSKKGLFVISKGACEVVIMKGEQHVSIYCV